MQNSYRKFSRFFKEIRGSIATTTALLSVPIFLSVGFAVDYTRMTQAQSQMQQAADAAALAAASLDDELSKRELSVFARKFFRANGMDAEVEKTKRINGRYKNTNVVVTAELVPETYLLQVFWKGEVKIRVVSEAIRSIGGLELAMLIDNTASMGFGTTWNNATDAVDRMLSELEDKTVNGEFYTTLIPYTDRINIGPSRKNWLAGPGSAKYRDYADGDSTSEWEEALEDWEGCVEPLEEPVTGYPYNLALGDPDGSFVPSVEEYWGGIRESRGSKRSECAVELVGPTNNINEITNGMRKLKPLNATGRFDDALAWGWRAVTSQYQGEWGAGPDYPSTGDQRQKVVALFTDGRTNINEEELEARPGEFGNNNGSKTLFSHVEQVCERMKDDGVTVVIFHVIGNDNARPYFERCAGENYHAITNKPEFDNALHMLTQINDVARLVR